MCTVLLPPGVNPIAVKNTSFHFICCLHDRTKDLYAGPLFIGVLEGTIIQRCFIAAGITLAKKLTSLFPLPGQN